MPPDVPAPAPRDDARAHGPPAPIAPPRDGRAARWLLVAALAAGAALRLHAAVTDDGIAWPDEIYQSLEPAHRLVWGRGFVPLEFREGLRSWTLAGLVAALLEVLRVLGLSTPALYVRAAKCVFALVGVATGWATARLARRSGADPLGAAAAGALWALSAPAVYFGMRGLSEPLSALPVTLGLALALPSDASRRDRLLGASLLGFAVLLRLQDALLCAGLVAVWLARRRWREAAGVTTVLAGWALAFGLLDRLTWGGWFHSALAYWRYNWVQGRGALFGAMPAGYYLHTLWTAMPLVAALALVAGLAGVRRAPALAALVALFVGVHMRIPHKELRFVLPVLPAALALAGVGLSVLARAASARAPLLGRVPVALALAAGVASAAHVPALTFGELGAYDGQRDRTSAWDDFGAVNRLLLAASARADACGLKVEAVHVAWSGGYTYFHRDARMYGHLGPPRERGLYNYVLTVPRAVPTAAVVARDGPLVLARLFEGPCAPDPGYRSDLP